MSSFKGFIRRAIRFAMSRALRLTYPQLDWDGGLPGVLHRSAEHRDAAVRQEFDRIVDARMRSVTEGMAWIGSELERLDKRIDACERRLDLRENEAGRGQDRTLGEVTRLDKRIDACEQRADVSESDARWLRSTLVGVQNDSQMDLEQSKIALQSITRQIRRLEALSWSDRAEPDPMHDP